MDDRVDCRTPTPGRSGVTRIPRWKYDRLRAAILGLVRAAGPDGVTFGALPDAVREKLSPEELSRLGSVTWHVTTVELDLEVTGEIERVPGATPQRLKMP